MKNCAKIIAAVMVVFIGAGYAEGASIFEFTDIYNNPKLMWYCSQKDHSSDGVAGVTGVCAAGWYYYTETVSGFRNQNNPNDPKRLCQKDTACNPEPAYIMIGGTYNSNNPSDVKVPPLFRVYIPPGITGISMSLYVSPVRVAVVARMGQPPANPSKPLSEYGNIQSVGLNLDDLMNGGELWTRNADGNIQIFYGGGNINYTMLQNKGFSDRWLYVQVVKYDATWLQTLTWNMTIGDMKAYKEWYNSVVDWEGCYAHPENAANCSGTPTPYTVTFQAGTGGTVNGSTSQTVSSGSSTTSVTATPNANYTFVNWTGTNGFTSTSKSLTVPSVMASATITANFMRTEQLKIIEDVPNIRGRFALQREITVDNVKGYSSMVLVPELTFRSLPQGMYDLYAVVALPDKDKSDKYTYYVATKDSSQQIIFIEWKEGDEVRVYETQDLSGGDRTIVFTAFESIKKNATTLFSPHEYASNGVRFLVAIAPKGSSNLNTLINNFRGAEIYFSPDIIP